MQRDKIKMMRSADLASLNTAFFYRTPPVHKSSRQTSDIGGLRPACLTYTPALPARQRAAWDIKRHRPSLSLSHLPHFGPLAFSIRAMRGFSLDYLDLRTGDRQSPGMTLDTPTFLSPGQAAKRARCGRTSIMRALQTQQLKAHRDNAGNWQIGAADLDDWASMRRTPDRQSPVTSADMPTEPPADMLRTSSADAEKRAAEAAARAAAAEARAEGLEARLLDAQNDRDHWRNLAESLSRTIHARPGFLDRLTTLLRR